jgi:hypothetical protein
VRSLGAPLLEGVVVREHEVVEGDRVVRKGVRSAQVVFAGSDLTESIKRECIVIERQAVCQRMEGAALI